MINNTATAGRTIRLSALLLGMASIFTSTTASAAAFQIQEQAVSYLGTAYAGTAAWANGAEAAFYNPAALTKIKNKQVVASGTIIHAESDFTATSSSALVFTGGAPTLISPVPGPQTDDGGGFLYVPGLHYAARLSDDLVFGLSVVTPFGLKTSYSDTRVLRYVATDSELIVLDISPSIAWQPDTWISFGAGLDIELVKARLNGQSTVSGGAQPDGFQRNVGQDWALGWHLGVLVELCPTTRFGINFRSEVNVDLEGISEQLTGEGVPNALFPSPGLHTHRNVHASVTLPAAVVFSAYHEFTQQFAAMVDVHWTGWHVFKELELSFTPPPTSNAVIVVPENFDNTFRIAVGGNYKKNDRWQYRAGVALDRSPVNDTDRTARIPDENRVWVALGASYTKGCIQVDFGYAHIFFNDASLNDAGPLNATTRRAATVGVTVPVIGNFDQNANILGVQVRYDFV